MCPCIASVAYLPAMHSTGNAAKLVNVNIFFYVCVLSHFWYVPGGSDHFKTQRDLSKVAHSLESELMVMSERRK